MTHPEVGRLRAFADHELGLLAHLRCAFHQRRCPACRAALAEQERVRAVVTRSLRAAAPPVDAGEAWARLAAVGGVAPGRPRSLASGGHGLQLGWFAGLALALGALVLLWARPERDTFPSLSGGEARAAEIQDLCCWDLDGGGPGDDGVLTVTLPGERVVAVTLYEDRNGSRSFNGLEPLRYGATPSTEGPVAQRGVGVLPPPDTRGRIDAPRIRRDFCCADYDRGGRPDDGVLAHSRDGEVVEDVLLYEDLDASRSFTRLDLVRWRGSVADP